MLMNRHKVIKIYRLFILLNTLSTVYCSLFQRNFHTTPSTKSKKDILNMLSTDNPIALLNRLKNNIKRLEAGDDAKLDLIKDKSRYIKKSKINIYSIMATPTNARRVYLRSKTNFYLQMNKRGELNGTRQINENVIFIMESMSKGVIRLKGEASGKYICMNRSQRIVIKSKAAPKCLLRQYLEENNYVLFWSKIFSTEIAGENGWFLALRPNGKMKSPKNTRLGDKSTMFHIHHVDNTT